MHRRAERRKGAMGPICPEPLQRTFPCSATGWPTRKTRETVLAKHITPAVGFGDSSRVFQPAHGSPASPRGSYGRLFSSAPAHLPTKGGLRQPHPHWATEGEKPVLPVKQTKRLSGVFCQAASYRGRGRRRHEISSPKITHTARN